MNKKASAKKSFLSFFGALTLILGFRWIVFEPYVIPSGSMIPTLLINDHVVVSKYDFGLRIPFSEKWLLRWSEPERGEIVVFQAIDKDNSYFMVKRVLGLAGDVITFSENGSVQVNSRPIIRAEIPDFNEFKELDGFYSLDRADIQSNVEYLNYFTEDLEGKSYRVMQLQETKDWSDSEFVVPDNHILVVGDNRDNSSDGRYWGFLPIENVIGKAKIVWLSCLDSLAGSSFLCEPSTIRWSRFFHKIK